MSRIAAFAIVEVVGHGTVIPNNCTTTVRAARDTDYLAGFINTVRLTVYMFRSAVLQRFELSDAIFSGPNKSV